MNERRLIKSGTGSYVISLPINWVRQNKLERGDLLSVQASTDGIITILPKKRGIAIKKREIEIHVDSMNSDEIKNAIVSAYLNSYSTIYLRGKNIFERAVSIKKIINTLIGLSIVEEDTDFIACQDFLNVETIDVKRTMKRVSAMVDGILKDAQKTLSSPKLYDAVVQKNQNVSGQCFLLLRVLRMALQDSNIGLHVGLKPLEILSQWVVVRELDNISDHGMQIAKFFSKQELTPKERKVINTIFSIVYEHVVDAIGAYETNDTENAVGVIAEKREVIEQCMSFSLKSQKREIAALVEELKKIEKSAVIIARVTVDGD